MSIRGYISFNPKPISGLLEGECCEEYCIIYEGSMVILYLMLNILITYEY
jgi:hypothetical protein